MAGKGTALYSSPKPEKVNKTTKYGSLDCSYWGRGRGASFLPGCWRKAPQEKHLALVIGFLQFNSVLNVGGKHSSQPLALLAKDNKDNESIPQKSCI